MSISFTAQDSPAGEDNVFECQCVDFGDTYAANPECTECKGTGEIRFSTLQYDVNFSNNNAWQFTELFTQDGNGSYCGRIKAEDMPKAIDKLLKADVCDRRRGYLLPVLEWAKANNKDVCWG